MNTAQLATRVQMAALPEGEYGLMHPRLGHLNLAYPEVRVGLRFTNNPESEPLVEDDWVIIECQANPIDLRRGLLALGEAYQHRDEQEPLLYTPKQADSPKYEHSFGADDPSDPPLADVGLGVSVPATRQEGPSAVTGAKAGTVSPDLEAVLIHYLGTHLLRTLRHAPDDVMPWWVTASQSPELHSAVARAHRVLLDQEMLDKQ